MLYFDYAASTPMRKEVLDEMYKLAQGELNSNFANPSSVHSLGQKQREIILNSRAKISKCISAKESEIYFTSGATEANNWAIQGVLSKYKNEKIHIISTKIEHSSIYNLINSIKNKDISFSFLEVDDKAQINLDDLKSKIREETRLISIAYVNNELGSVSDIKEISKIARDENILFHSDMTQALSYFDIDVKELGISMASFSSHKVYGPKSIGMLYVKNDCNINPMIVGGTQQNSKRAGTEDAILVSGFAKAIELIAYGKDKNRKKIKELKEYLVSSINKNFKNARLNAYSVDSHPAILNVSFQGIPSEFLLISLDMRGIAVSAGSACQSSQVKVSRVLKEVLKDSKRASESIRISLGEFSKKEDIDFLISQLVDIISK